jgi:predicted branched-subunit amino acid permease
MLSAFSRSPVPDDNPARPLNDGVWAAFSIPGVSIFANMVGFAAIARQAGFDLPMTLATTLLVWGMPGQVAMASLHIAGASLLVIFTAVALANMRMLLMSISGMEMMALNEGRHPFWQKVLLMQMLAITSWVQIGMVEGRYSKPGLVRYFAGFASVIYALGMLGTLAGYYLSDWASPDVLRAVLVITPLYILLMVINARRMLNRVAGVAGGALCPVFYPVLGEWSILIGGIAAGTMVVMADRFWQRASTGAGGPE